jgi:hypothetical protein
LQSAGTPTIAFLVEKSRIRLLTLGLASPISAALAFWNAHLRGDARTKQYLQSNALELASHGAVKLSRR